MKNIKIAVFTILASLSFILNAQTVIIKNETKDFILDIKYPQGFVGKGIDSTINELIKTIRNEEANPESSDMPADLPGKNSLYIDYKIMYETPHTLSIVFSISTYAKGAAHPNNTVRTLNFIDGKQVGLSDLFKPESTYLTNIAAYCRAKLLKIDGADEKWITSGSEPTAENYQYWHFTKEGIAIIFDTYQVVAYVYGPQTIIVPQSSLKNELRPGVEKAVWGNA